MDEADNCFLMFTCTGKISLVISLSLLIVILTVASGTAATTSIHIEKIADDGKTVLASKDVDAGWMEANLPVYGDGFTHYYHQGPVFIDDPDNGTESELRWNRAEDRNVLEKDMGAVRGTGLRDLCDLVGGMGPGATVKIKAGDGFSKTFAYRNVYLPTDRQGPMVITWYRNGEGYVPDYATGMRLVFFADNTTNPWGLHAFGNWDWHESADPEYYYYYTQGGEKFPTTTGLSVQDVASITINENPPGGTTSQPTPAVPIGVLAALLGTAGAGWIVTRREGR